MKLTKLTALSILLFSSGWILTSCEPDEELKKTIEFERTGISMTGSQETPPNTASGLGTLNVHYNRNTKILTYSAAWSGLTGAVTAMHIHGLAPGGFAAGVVQTISTSAIAKCSGSGNTSCGSYNGTLYVDGVVVKEQDLLNGVYYLNIHTAAFPGGEIRGQVIFQ